MSDTGTGLLFDVSVNTRAPLFLRELPPSFRINLRPHAHPLWPSDILRKLERRKTRAGGRESGEKRAVINTKRIDLLGSRRVCPSASDCSVLIIHLCSR